MNLSKLATLLSFELSRIVFPSQGGLSYEILNAKPGSRTIRPVEEIHTFVEYLQIICCSDHSVLQSGASGFLFRVAVFALILKIPSSLSVRV